MFFYHALYLSSNRLPRPCYHHSQYSHHYVFENTIRGAQMITDPAVLTLLHCHLQPPSHGGEGGGRRIICITKASSSSFPYPYVVCFVKLPHISYPETSFSVSVVCSSTFPPKALYCHHTNVVKHPCDASRTATTLCGGNTSDAS